MNEGVLLLKEVAKLKDIVSLGVCVSIFQTCNGKQFKNMPASDFFCFLNLKLPKEKETVYDILFGINASQNAAWDKIKE